MSENLPSAGVLRGNSLNIDYGIGMRFRTYKVFYRKCGLISDDENVIVGDVVRAPLPCSLRLVLFSEPMPMFREARSMWFDCACLSGLSNASNGYPL